jgi:hypothetical protein
VDEPTARDYLQRGLGEITGKQAASQRREDYYRGRQDKPFAPQGVNQEYMALREMAIANWLGLAMDAPCQRLRVDGFRTGRRGDADERAWIQVWQANRLDARQRIVYQQRMVQGRGVVSVWPNPKAPQSPVVRVEETRQVHIEMDPEDSLTTLWAVKSFSIQDRPGAGDAALWTPMGLSPDRQVAVVYDGVSWARFERGGRTFSPDWLLVAGGAHPLGAVPFVAFDNDPDALNRPHDAITPLIPAQDAINTIRFNTLLAMQFSAFRQRVFTGYDPVVRDQQGNPVYRMNADGTPVLDAQGQPVPLLNSPGRIGVDRALVFPGVDTKVFDLPESNLGNYINVLGEFLTQLFAVAQIPPQYLLSRMANLSGDALAGAESTLASLVADLQTSSGESWEQVMRLCNAARGEQDQDLASEVIWGDAEARSFAQVVDAITKLIQVGFPRTAAFEMIPGATPQKVDRWMDLASQEVENGEVMRAARALELTAAPQAPVAAP